MPFIVGVTGGIGCGKSTVAQAFAALGVETLDADDLARAVSEPGGSAYADIATLFGDATLLSDGRLNRAFIRQRIFTDPGLRARLESIVHPHVATETTRRMAQWRGPYGLWIVPLLFEKPGLRNCADRILVIDCPEPIQIARVTASRGLNEDEVRAIIATQCPRPQRLALADDVLDNSGPSEDLPAKVASLDQHYHALAQKQLRRAET